MLARARQQLFGMEPWSSHRRYDATFLGVPSAHGVLGVTSTAGGPSALRAMSAVYPASSDHDGRCKGWHDYCSGGPILQGRELSDAGDFVVDRSQGSNQFDALVDDVARVAANSRLTVVIGGDHSICFWLSQVVSNAVLVIIDAHEDSTAKTGPFPHHGNFVTFIEGLSPSFHIIQFGLRGLVPSGRRGEGPTRTICRNTEHLLSKLAEYRGRPIHISLDVDVFDPRLIQAVTSPCPCGISVDDLLYVLKAIVDSGHDVRLFDLCEFAPSGEMHRIEALTLVNVLLRSAEILLNAHHP